MNPLGSNQRNMSDGFLIGNTQINEIVQFVPFLADIIGIYFALVCATCPSTVFSYQRFSLIHNTPAQRHCIALRIHMSTGNERL